METAVQPLSEILNLNTDMVVNSLDGVSESEAAGQPIAGANSASFLLAHLVDARYFFARLIGERLENPHHEAFRAVRSMADAASLPPLSEMRDSWLRVSAHIMSALEKATPETLASVTEQRFPVDDRTVVGALAFLAQHESYHLGQLALLRKALGHGGVSYDRKQGAGGLEG